MRRKSIAALAIFLSFVLMSFAGEVLFPVYEEEDSYEEYLYEIVDTRKVSPIKWIDPSINPQPWELGKTQVLDPENPLMVLSLPVDMDPRDWGIRDDLTSDAPYLNPQQDVVLNPIPTPGSVLLLFSGLIGLVGCTRNTGTLPS